TPRIGSHGGAEAHAKSHAGRSHRHIEGAAPGDSAKEGFRGRGEWGDRRLEGRVEIEGRPADTEKVLGATQSTTWVTVVLAWPQPSQLPSGRAVPAWGASSSEGWSSDWVISAASWPGSRLRWVSRRIRI